MGTSPALYSTLNNYLNQFPSVNTTKIVTDYKKTTFGK